MIALREYMQDETEKIKDILMIEEIDDLDINEIIYIMLEDNNIIGISKVEVENNNANLKYLMIRKDNRHQNFGDGLLRAVLNKLDNQGIEKVFYKNSNSYFIKKGFSLNDENQLELNIPKFFINPCCSGECNEL